jgi:hypothetical protein
MEGLSKEAKALLRKTDRGGKVESFGDAVRELETRLLAHAASLHTEQGHHGKELQSWKAWAKSTQLGKVELTPADAKIQIESVVARLNKQTGARATLPWQAKRR